MYDRHLIGRTVEREVESRGSWTAFAKDSGVSRATLARVRDADERVSVQIMRQIERALSLPFDTFQAIAVHDFQGLREIGVEEGLVRWVERESTVYSASDAPTTRRTRSTRDTSQG